MCKESKDGSDCPMSKLIPSVFCFSIILDHIQFCVSFLFQRCLHAYQHKKGDGTTTPRRHQCADLKKAQRAKEKLSNPTADEKKAVLQSGVEMVSRDLLPYRLASGTGFRQFVQSVSKYDYSCKSG